MAAVLVANAASLLDITMVLGGTIVQEYVKRTWTKKEITSDGYLKQTITVKESRAGHEEAAGEWMLENTQGALERLRTEGLRELGFS